MNKSLVWKIFPKLETQRLLLNKIEPRHAPDLLAFWGDDAVTEYTDFESYSSMAKIEEIIHGIRSYFEKQGGIRFGIFLKDGGKLIGTCGFNSWVTERGNRGEIGYDLHQNYWRQGYMYEALKEILQYGFQEMKLHRIEADVDPHNVASQKLLEKIGFTKEGCLRDVGYWKGQYWTNWIYGILENEFQQE